MIFDLKGSDATGNLAPGMAAGYRELHQKLIDNGSLVPDGKWLKFKKDTLSPYPMRLALSGL